jgi:golgi pH regulator
MVLKLIQDLGIVLTTSGGFFAFAWFFFARHVFKNFEITSRIPLVLFASMFTLSCNMFELVIFEILDVTDRRYDLGRFQVIILLLLIALYNIVIVLPGL